MGTTWNAVIPQGKEDAAKLRGIIQGSLNEVDQAMSTWDSESELSRFNAGPDLIATWISPNTMTVIGEALSVAEISGGAFDPTILPLVELWGFGSTPQGEIPNSKAIDAALENIGWQKVTAEGTWLQRESTSIQLDLSGIAKGWGTDQAGEALSAAGWDSWLVEVGGEIRCQGMGPDETPWRIGLDRPLTGGLPGEQFQAIVELKTSSIATSGDYRNWRNVEGQRLSHTLDPRTGQPVNHNLASATVIAAKCVKADAFATAVCVLGAEVGLKLVESLEGVEAFLVVRDGEEFQEISSSGFPATIRP